MDTAALVGRTRARPVHATNTVGVAGIGSVGSSPGSLLRLQQPRCDHSTVALRENCRLGMRDTSSRFDRYARFLGSHASSSIPHDLAEAAQRTVLDIEQVMIEADRAIQAKLKQLRCDIDHFVKGVADHGDPRWYRNLEDLTAFNDTKFVEMLNIMHIRDVKDFAAYLNVALPEAAKQNRPDHEYVGRSFVGKVHLLLERVLEESRSDYSIPLSLFVTVKAKVLLPHMSRVHRRFLERELDYIDTTLRWMLDRHSKSTPNEQYWDFAASWRELVYAWENVVTDPGALIRLLNTLQKKAEVEIHDRTRLAVNGRLPVELADLILEDAMLAEEIPFESE